MSILNLCLLIRKINPTAKTATSTVKTFNLKTAITNVIPALSWFPSYDFRKNIAGDFIAGFTCAIMHIPQGMAYGLLAGLDPIVGLYMAFFPALIYFLFGTSRHISVGTFAVVSIMTSKIVTTYSDPNYGSDESQVNATLNGEISQSYSNYQVATAVTLVCGIFQLIMSFLKLGVLASLLSTSLVSGFTTAAGGCLILLLPL